MNIESSLDIVYVQVNPHYEDVCGQEQVAVELEIGESGGVRLDLPLYLHNHEEDRDG